MKMAPLSVQDSGATRLLLRLRDWLDRGQVFSRCDVTSVRQMSDLSLGGIVDADAGVVESRTNRSVKLDA